MRAQSRRASSVNARARKRFACGCQRVRAAGHDAWMASPAARGVRARWAGERGCARCSRGIPLISARSSHQEVDRRSSSGAAASQRTRSRRYRYSGLRALRKAYRTREHDFRWAQGGARKGPEAALAGLEQGSRPSDAHFFAISWTASAGGSRHPKADGCE